MIITGARLHGNELILSLANPAEAGKLVYRFKEGDYELEKVGKKRSLEANRMLWAFCEKIAQKVKSTKEEVYRAAVRDVGVYYPLPIKAEAVEEFDRTWRMHGIGWFVDVVDDSKIPGYKLCFAYAGSSSYNVEQMSRLLDNILQDAVALDIETFSQEQIEKALNDWRRGCSL